MDFPISAVAVLGGGLCKSRRLCVAGFMHLVFKSERVGGLWNF